MQAGHGCHRGPRTKDGHEEEAEGDDAQDQACRQVCGHGAPVQYSAKQQHHAGDHGRPQHVQAVPHHPQRRLPSPKQRAYARAPGHGLDGFENPLLLHDPGLGPFTITLALVP